MGSLNFCPQSQSKPAMGSGYGSLFLPVPLQTRVLGQRLLRGVCTAQFSLFLYRNYTFLLFAKEQVSVWFFPCVFSFSLLSPPLSRTHISLFSLSVPCNPLSTLFCYLSAPSHFPWTLYSFLAFIHVYSHQDTHTLNGQRLGAMYGRGCMVFVYLSLGCLG